MTTPSTAPAAPLPNGSEIREIARLATMANQQRRVFATPAGKTLILNKDERLEHAPDPDALIETTEVQDIGTFVALVKRFQRPESTLFYNRQTGEITAIIDYHATADGTPGATKGLKRHRITLIRHSTPEWAAWHGIHKKPLTQSQFAEFLEARAGECRAPTAAEMLELARSFEAVSNSEFASGVRLSNGDTQLVFKANTSATMRNAEGGRVDVPSEFEITVRPWYGSDPVNMRALFRYRVQDGSVRFSVVFMPEPAEAMQFAVEVEAQRISELSGLPLHIAVVPAA